MSRWTW